MDCRAFISNEIGGGEYIYGGYSKIVEAGHKSVQDTLDNFLSNPILPIITPSGKGYTTTAWGTKFHSPMKQLNDHCLMLLSDPFTYYEISERGNGKKFEIYIYDVEKIQ